MPDEASPSPQGVPVAAASLPAAAVPLAVPSSAAQEPVAVVSHSAISSSLPAARKNSARTLWLGVALGSATAIAIGASIAVAVLMTKENPPVASRATPSQPAQRTVERTPDRTTKFNRPQESFPPESAGRRAEEKVAAKPTKVPAPEKISTKPASEKEEKEADETPKSDKPAAEGPAQPRTLAEIIETAEPSVVQVLAQLDDGISLGSGFVLSDSGQVVTNHHVIAGAKSATVCFADKSTSEVMGYVAIDPDKDIAILRIRAGKKLHPLAVSDGIPKKGKKTIALGSPEGLSFSASEGIVAALRDDKELFRDSTRKMTYIQQRMLDKFEADLADAKKKTAGS